MCDGFKGGGAVHGRGSKNSMMMLQFVGGAQRWCCSLRKGLKGDNLGLKELNGDAAVCGRGSKVVLGGAQR